MAIKKWIFSSILCLLLCMMSGCGKKDVVRTDGYEYLIGVSFTNVMEPWLNNLAQVIEAKAEKEKNVNLIFRDAVGSTEKQIQDIEALMECGIDLLIVSPDGSEALNGTLEEVFAKIPIVVVGVEPETEAYTTLIQADDQKIGEMAGSYILDHVYEEGNRIIVIEGVKGSPISDRRRNGFVQAVEGHIPDENLVYVYGDWLRDTAESRMKDYLVVNGTPDIVFAFNDEMAYGANIAYDQFRMRDGIKFIGVDGFDGESAGLNLVDKKVLDATIQSPDFGALAYDKTLEILKGKEVERHIQIVPKLITGD